MNNPYPVLHKMNNPLPFLNSVGTGCEKVVHMKNSESLLQAHSQNDYHGIHSKYELTKMGNLLPPPSVFTNNADYHISTVYFFWEIRYTFQTAK